MKSFEYAAPKSLKEAAALLGGKWGETEILAGGTDLVTSLKQGITAPKRVVSLRHLTELKGIKAEGDALRIGATTTLAELIANATVKQQFPSLVSAATGIGGAQILSAGTVGGDLCQRPRCWYFRNGYGLFAKQGNVSLVREGDNRYHAIFGTDKDALFVSASSLGPALAALDATVVIAGANGRTRNVSAAEFFQTPQTELARETALRPNEIVTGILVPNKGLRNATYEVRHRHGLDWPYVTASVAYQLEGGVARQSRIVLGHVAATPWIAPKAAEALNGQRITEETAGKCGEAAIAGAKPLSKNDYKVQMVKTAVKRAVLAARA